MAKGNKKAYLNSPGVPQNRVNFEPGDNSRMIKDALEGFKHPRVDTKDPAAIAERMQEYLEYCIEHDCRPLVGGCANWLGVDIKTLERWYTGEYGTIAHQEIAARFYGVIKALWDEYMQNGKINPVAGIYISKVYFGYKDTQEINVTTKQNDSLSISDLIKASKMLPGAEKVEMPEGLTMVEDN